MPGPLRACVPALSLILMETATGVLLGVGIGVSVSVALFVATVGELVAVGVLDAVTVGDGVAVSVGVPVGVSDGIISTVGNAITFWLASTLNSAKDSAVITTRMMPAMSAITT